LIFRARYDLIRTQKEDTVALQEIILAQFRYDFNIRLAHIISLHALMLLAIVFFSWDNIGFLVLAVPTGLINFSRTI